MVMGYIYVIYYYVLQGIVLVLLIFREGILNGFQEMKVQVVDGLGELINIISVEAFKFSVVNIIGFLIRIFGDRFFWQVKVVVLETFILFFVKVCFIIIQEI